jgi:hypothetical protein
MYCARRVSEITCIDSRSKDCKAKDFKKSLEHKNQRIPMRDEEI